MTLSTSAVAVCCCNDSPQLVEQSKHVLDSDDGLGRKVLHKFDLFVGEGANLLTINSKHTDQLVLLKHRDDEKRSCARDFS